MDQLCSVPSHSDWLALRYLNISACNTLHFRTSLNSTDFNALHSIALHNNALHRTEAQYTTTHCTTMHQGISMYTVPIPYHCNTLHKIAVRSIHEKQYLVYKLHATSRFNASHNSHRATAFEHSPSWRPEAGQPQRDGTENTPACSTSGRCSTTLSNTRTQFGCLPINNKHIKKYEIAKHALNEDLAEEQLSDNKKILASCYSPTSVKFTRLVRSAFVACCIEPLLLACHAKFHRCGTRRGRQTCQLSRFIRLCTYVETHWLRLYRA